MFTAAALLAAGWITDAQNIAKQIQSAGKVAGAAFAVVFMLVAYAVKRTLGAVFGALVVAGVVLYAINNTDMLKSKTEETINNTSGPADAVGMGRLGGVPTSVVVYK